MSFDTDQTGPGAGAVAELDNKIKIKFREEIRLMCVTKDVWHGNRMHEIESSTCILLLHYIALI